MMSIERAKTVAAAAEKYGYVNAATKLGMSKESVRRSCRLWKAAGNPLKVPDIPFMKAPDSGVRVLLYDIETIQHHAKVWDVWKQNIAPCQITRYGRILCFAAKWLGSDEILFERGERTDKELCRTLVRLHDQADIVIVHNGRSFDDAYLRTRLAYHGIPPPMPYRLYDTCLKARRLFNFPHNSLDGLARYFGVGQKVPHQGQELWDACEAGDPEAWAKMEEYNIGDVLLMEEVYLRIRPYDKQPPNMALGFDDGVARCPVCGAAALKSLPKVARTAVLEFEAFRCQSCGGLCRSRKSLPGETNPVRGCL